MQSFVSRPLYNCALYNDVILVIRGEGSKTNNHKVEMRFRISECTLYKQNCAFYNVVILVITGKLLCGQQKTKKHNRKDIQDFRMYVLLISMQNLLQKYI